LNAMGPSHNLLQSLCQVAKAGVWASLLEAVSEAFDGDILFACKAYDADVIRERANERGALGQHSTEIKSPEKLLILEIPQQTAEQGRMLLQQTHAIPRHRHMLRQIS